MATGSGSLPQGNGLQTCWITTSLTSLANLEGSLEEEERYQSFLGVGVEGTHKAVTCPVAQEDKHLPSQPF